MRLYKDFNFDAAHHLPHVFPEGHPNHRLHGHSYRVRVTVSGRPDPETGMITSLENLAERISAAREALDHRYLNEDVPGLEFPTLELIAMWIWRFLKPDLPNLAEVSIHRDPEGNGCLYRGEFE